MKEHKGYIKGRKINSSLGSYYLVTHWYGHPDFGTRPTRGGHTSYVVEENVNQTTGHLEIETLNSRYTFVPDDWRP